MRISDWSSDVCSSDLLPAPSKSLCPAGEDLPRHHIRRPGSKVEGRSSRYSALTLIAERGFGELHDFRIGIRHIHRRSEEHTSELQSLMRISYAVFCLKKKKKQSRQSHNLDQDK